MPPPYQTRPPKDHECTETSLGQTALGQLIKSTIAAYQIQAGIPEYILKNTKSLPWTQQ